MHHGIQNGREGEAEMWHTK